MFGLAGAGKVKGASVDSFKYERLLNYMEDEMATRLRGRPVLTDAVLSNQLRGGSARMDSTGHETRHESRNSKSYSGGKKQGRDGYSKGGSGHQKKIFHGTCDVCFKYGHKGRDCRDRHPGSRRK